MTDQNMPGKSTNEAKRDARAEIQARADYLVGVLQERHPDMDIQHRILPNGNIELGIYAPGAGNALQDLPEPRSRKAR